MAFKYTAVAGIMPWTGYDGYLAFYMPQTSQQVVQSAPGIRHAKSAPAER
jgi:hypothetical protein